MLPEYLPPAEDEALIRITRLIRRICLLHEQGEVTEASRQEHERLKTEIRDFRLTRGPEALPESALTEIFVVERKRAIEAVALAEMIIPQLLRRVPGPPASAPTPARSPVPAPELLPATMSGAPAIPDLLDAMLARERPARRP